MPKRFCVVLNNQMAFHIDESAGRAAMRAGAQFVFQAESSRRLIALKKFMDASKAPVPVFFAEGRRSGVVSASGLLREVRFREDLTSDERKRYRTLISDSDRSLYGRTFALVSDVTRRDPVSLKSFRKVSDARPARSGSWVASVCEMPSQKVLRSRSRLNPADDESLSGLEGAERSVMIRHRAREAKLRRAKITRVLRDTQRLCCEVKGCGFDFHAQYGTLGEMYAQVHHLVPLGERRGQTATPLKDLSIVCANCHVMIHRHGECRTMNEIARALRAGLR